LVGDASAARRSFHVAQTIISIKKQFQHGSIGPKHWAYQRLTTAKEHGETVREGKNELKYSVVIME